MNLISVYTDATDLGLVPLGDRLYKLTYDLNVRIEFDNGLVYLYSFNREFVTNFRSGAPVIDCFVDQIGSSLTALAYLVHDANYTPCHYLFDRHPLPKEDADKLLRAMLRYAGMSGFKSQVVYDAVKLFGKSAYEDDDELTEKNKYKFAFYRKVI